MKIKEEWVVEFRAVTDTKGFPDTLGTYSTHEEAEEAIHRAQNTNSVFYLSKITVNETLVDTFFS